MMTNEMRSPVSYNSVDENAVDQGKNIQNNNHAKASIYKY